MCFVLRAPLVWYFQREATRTHHPNAASPSKSGLRATPQRVAHRAPPAVLGPGWPTSPIRWAPTAEAKEAAPPEAKMVVPLQFVFQMGVVTQALVCCFHLPPILEPRLLISGEPE